jgi:periplasmic divalent cation tolerance protein
MYVVAMTTAPSEEKGAEIARALVEAGLAACVQLVPIARSVYRWQGKMCEEPEILCLIKTRRDRVDACRERVVALHPYAVPEFVVVSVDGGHLPYLQWIDASCS